MSAIDTSLFELFKIGPGPSSSHTIGPMLAGLHFREALETLERGLWDRAAGLGVELLGSLGATAEGHGTWRAVTAGLLGWRPESVDPEALSALWTGTATRLETTVAGRALGIRRKDLRIGPTIHLYPYSNTLLLRLLDQDGAVLWQRAYYSVGGGFIQWEGQEPAPRGKPLFPYQSMAQLQLLMEEEEVGLTTIILANERAVHGLNRAQVEQGLDRVIGAMLASVERGLKATGLLPGPIGLSRKAAILYGNAHQDHNQADQRLLLLNAYALAAAEENAAGGVVVTAPTLGSAGVVPAALALLARHFRLAPPVLRRALLASAVVGFLIKHNASIAGAEVGCQGEIGSASAMAAALLAAAFGHPVEAMAAAAEIALEHHLGLTCDPVGGYVQIPCIERNAMGAVKAYNAFLLATAGDPSRQKIGFDHVVKVMLVTGRDMHHKYKETSQGGLALPMATC